MARKSKFVKPVRDLIVQALRLGATYEIAAEYAGISRSTLYNWMERGQREKTGEYRAFLDSIKQADAKGAIANLALVETAAKAGDWKAAAWRLERRHGYTKDAYFQNQQKEKELAPLPKNIIDVLRLQADELRGSIAQAKEAQSWQAYAALQKQFISILAQIRQIEAEENMGDEMDGFTDDQLIAEIMGAILSLPPIHRQKLENDILSTRNVIAISKNEI